LRSDENIIAKDEFHRARIFFALFLFDVLTLGYNIFNEKVFSDSANPNVIRLHDSNSAADSRLTSHLHCGAADSRHHPHAPAPADSPPNAHAPAATDGDTELSGESVSQIA